MTTVRYKHLAVETSIAVHEDGGRGVSVERVYYGPWNVHMTLHNGCKRGNIRSKMTKDEALQLAVELIRACE